MSTEDAYRDWQQAEAVLIRYEAWMDTLPVPQMFCAHGDQSPPFATWQRLCERAARMHSALGDSRPG